MKKLVSQCSPFEEEKSMPDVMMVLDRISRGATVRIVHDSYGRETVMIYRWWFPLPHRIKLTRKEMVDVKRALNERTPKIHQEIVALE